MVEENISTPQHEKTHTNRLKRNRILSLMAVIFLLLAIGYVIYWLVWGRLEIFTDDAYVNGNIVKLMPQISGTVVSINTDDTHLVKTGQILIKLDDTDAKIAFQHASAALAVTVRQVKQYYENAAAAQSMLIIRQADLVKAQLDFKRRSGLVGDRAISREEMQHYRTSLDAASAQYDIASHKLGSALALVENTHLYQHPLVIQAKTNFKTAYLNLQRTTIVAPVMGYIAKRNVEVGQQVDPSTWMLAIIPLKEVWIDANYKESQLRRIRIGQPATLTADALGGLKFHGTVVGLSPGTGSTFALLPPQNATGNWIKIVQRLPVRIALDPNELKYNPLRLGLSMRVTTYTRDLSGHLLPMVIDAKPIYTTSVYADQYAEADQMIDTIMKTTSPDVFLTVKKNA